MHAGTSSELSCEGVVEDLILLLDGALSGWRAEAVSAHLSGCGRCARFYASLREQLVLHQWAADADFAFDDADACLPEDLPDFAALSARLRVADFDQLGQVLYAVLKAEFLDVYGEGLAAQQAPVADPGAERRRAAEMVNELRDWHDADEVDGVDLREVARRIGPGAVDVDRLDALVEGMGTVARLAPDLAQAARYYQAIAHVKARRRPEAERLLQAVVVEGPPALVRIARICLATLPALLDDEPEQSIHALEGCLVGDRADAIVLYNLAKAHFQMHGQLHPDVRVFVERARAVDEAVVDQHLAQPSEWALREALARR